MSSELERRLEAVLAERPRARSGSGGGGAASRAACAASRRGSRARAPHRRPRLRRRRRSARDRRRLARRRRRAAHQLRREGEAAVRATSRPVLPKGANGLAAIVDGRLSVVTRGGFAARTARQRGGTVTTRALRRRRDRQLPGRDGAERAPSLVASGRREGRLDRLGAGRLPDRLYRPTPDVASPCTSSTATGSTTRRSTARCERCGPPGGATPSPSRTSAQAVARSSTTSATRAGRSSPCAPSPVSRSRPRECARAGGHERRVARGAIELPARRRRRRRGVRLAQAAGWPSQCPV